MGWEVSTTVITCSNQTLSNMLPSNARALPLSLIGEVGLGCLGVGLSAGGKPVLSYNKVSQSIF